MIALGVFSLGLLLGSFFNVVIFRLPEDKSIASGRSECRHCNKVVPWYLNIPIVSFLWLRGKSRCCAKPLSIQYPLVELATGVLFVLVFDTFGLTLPGFAYTVLCSYLLIISVIDFHHQIIPDELSLSGAVLGILAALFVGEISWISSLSGFLVGGGIFFSIAYLYEKFTGQEGLGGGDVKLLAMLGAWFGLESILIIVILSTVTGSLFGALLILTGKANTKAAIPFGPFLALAAVVYLWARAPLLAYFYPLSAQ
jgi:leader peptidase (prepilin peptidase) / N-methyltransferase